MSIEEIVKIVDEIRKRYNLTNKVPYGRMNSAGGRRTDGGPGSGPPMGNQNAYKGGGKSGGKGKDSEKGKDKDKTSSKHELKRDYPKLKSGAEYDKEILSICEHTADGDKLSKEYDEAVANLKDSDIVYQTDSNGKEVASVPHLAAMADTKVVGKDESVQAEYDRIKEEGKKITEDMLQVGKEAGVRFSGLENDIKGASHVSEKIDRKYDEWLGKGNTGTHADYVKQMGDCVRYTVMADNKDMAKQTDSVIKSLEDKGYKVTEVDNKFVGKDGKVDNGTCYRAIHLGVENENGQKAEVQIHSNESLAIKNDIHGMYEEYRSNDTPEARKNELYTEMQKHWAGYQNPDNIESIKTRK